MTEQADLQKQQSDALEAAHQQQLEALAQARAAAMASAHYWEGLASQAAQGEQASALRPPSPTTVTAAHFEYLEKVANAQYDFHRTLLTGTTGSG